MLIIATNPLPLQRFHKDATAHKVSCDVLRLQGHSYLVMSYVLVHYCHIFESWSTIAIMPLIMFLSLCLRDGLGGLPWS